MRYIFSLVAFMMIVYMGVGRASAKALAPTPKQIATFLEEIELDNVQEAKAKKLLRDARKQVIRFRSRKEILEIDLQSELEKSNSKVPKLLLMADSLALIESRLLKTRLHTWIKIQSLLKSPQKKQLSMLRRSRRYAGHDELIQPFTSRNQNAIF